MKLALIIAIAFAAGCDAATPVFEATTLLEDTSDTVGPYHVETVVIGATGDDQVELFYALAGDEQYVPLVMTEAEDGERFSGAIPGQPSGSDIAYFVGVLRDGDRITSDPDGAGARPFRFRIE